MIGYLAQKHLDRWIGSYVGASLTPKERRDPSQPTHILFCVVDHFEPGWNRPSPDVEAARVDAWIDRYPAIARRHRDADGRPPQHTFFFPAEEYRLEHIRKLAGLCRSGFGEVEIHLHHDQDTPEGFREKIERFKHQLAQEGLLSRDASGNLRYGFIHGNWALDNSLGDGRRCGVNCELQILKETGCYADLTLPSAPSAAQTRKINSLYYATDDPVRPKSHDWGVDVARGTSPSGDLMMIQGPLTLNWKSRAYGILPRIENGEIAGTNPPSPARVDLWIRQAIHVKGRPNWIVVKVHTHGTQGDNLRSLLGGQLDRLYADLESRYNDGSRYRLHYVTARALYNIIKAAEAGLPGDPSRYRDQGLVFGTDGG